jgi:riboflavin-specific deaminase-like protein
MTPAEARWENPVFFHDDVSRPWTALKLAISLDAKIAEAAGARSRLSSEAADEEVQRLRAGFDAILVGTRTALVDDPRLTVRGAVTPRVAPRRVLLDAAGRIAPTARVFREGPGEVWILTTGASGSEWRRRVESAGAVVIEVPSGPGGRVEARKAMEELRDRGVLSLLCEGGGELASSLVGAGLVDRLHLVVATRILGEGAVPAFPGLAPSEGAVGGSWRLGEDPRRLGEDVWLALEPARSKGR